MRHPILDQHIYSDVAVFILSEDASARTQAADFWRKFAAAEDMLVKVCGNRLMLIKGESAKSY